MTDPLTLKRALSLPQLVLYGLGTTIGAGIYALVGELAGLAGYGALASFLLAALMAALTALSFAELSSRFPYAAGAAVYVREGFASSLLSTLVGVLVISAGLVSAAALVNALVIHLAVYLSVGREWMIAVIVLALGLIAAWGIAESVAIAGLVTLIEVGGLVVVIAVSGNTLLDFDDHWQPLLEGFGVSHWGAIYAGALLAFYAFIGFEDMVVVAEEVKDVGRVLPRAILLTLAITTVLYLLVMASALLTFTPGQLASSAAPMVDIYRHHTGGSGAAIGTVAMFAIINGALIQMIMASRVLYGLSTRGQLPAWLAQVHPRTRTPLAATLLSTLIVLTLALFGQLASLAEITSLIMLCVFAMVNLALWRIKGRTDQSVGAVTFPRWVPALGFLISSIFVLSALLGR